MPDDYIYQPKPLPPNTPFGGNAVTDSTVQINPPDTYPVASAVPTESPFQSSTPTGEGGTPDLPTVDITLCNGTIIRVYGSVVE